MAPPDKSMSNGGRPWPAPGSRKRWPRCAGPKGSRVSTPAPRFRALFRPYQQTGVQWLHLLSQLGLGACLADDMGLGKTIQVLSLLLVQKNQASRKPKPCLLVAPASLLANWAAEIARLRPP